MSCINCVCVEIDYVSIVGDILFSIIHCAMNICNFRPEKIIIADYNSVKRFLFYCCWEQNWDIYNMIVWLSIWSFLV